MKEMVGGCCVCSDERGWPDNPLVYCDGNGCTVAVHQACYGIVTVPTGPWFCRKCESPDRQARVRCELCPSRAGALKRSDSGGWAHVVCALYIPEVRFGNVTSMEPIILQLIPSERFNKTCYICQESGKVNRATAGACMQCNKSGCKQQFHVTCAQSLGLLCEEAGNYLDNVKYCGYCRHHYGKLKKGGNVKTIPPYKPISQDSHSSDSSPEKDLDASPPGAVSGSSISDPAIPLISLLSSSSSKGSSKASTPGRKSSQSSQNSSTENLKATAPRVVTTKTPTHATSSESASTSVAFPKQSPHNSKAITSSKPSASQGKGDKSGRKKSPSPGDRKGPAPGGDAVPISVSIPSVSPHSQAKVNQQTSVNKLHQEPVVVINELPISTTSSGTTIITSALLEQIGALKFTNSNFTESVITPSDSVFGIGAESKQTKKRKAISQATASTSSYQAPSSTITSAKVSDTTSSGEVLWDGPVPTERASDSSRDDKTKKVKLDTTQQQSSSKSSTSSQIGGLNIQMEQNLSSPYFSNTSSNPPSTQGSPEKVYTLSGSTSSLEMISAPSPNLNTHVQNLSQKYPNVAQGRPDEPPTSLVVSVPLPQAGPVIQLTGHQNLSQKYPIVAQGRADEPPASLVVSVPLPQAGPVIQQPGHQTATTEATFIPPASPGPSSSSWGLKITYEPNSQPVQTEPMVVDEQSVPATRLRSESTDTGLRSHQPGVILDNSDKSQASGGARNKKRVPSAKYDSTIASSSPTPIPPPQKKKIPQSSPLTSQELTVYISPPSSPASSSSATVPPPKKKHIPRTPTEEFTPYLSPSYFPESRAARSVKSNIEKMARAPHMLGNELNPESAAAARLSEHLNAELAAHSVFRAPSPLVPPPLINRATSSRSISAAAGGPSTSAGPSTSGVPPISTPTADTAAGIPPVGLGGSAQSLDQLLERQWEQGSQFLMEQAQHFDIASLLSCLHQLRTENVRLQDYIGSLSQRRDHLLAVNARLAIPLNAVNVPAEVPRGPRDNNGNNVRPPNPVRADGNRANSLERQQMANRDTQPKSS